MHGKSLLNSRRTGFLAILLGSLGFASPLVWCQSAPKSPNGIPDIVGLYPGMPVGDAYNLLKGYYPTLGGKVDVHQDAIQGLNGNKPLATQLHIPPSDQQGNNDDLIDVFITLPPNKQVVWAVVRRISFEAGKSPSIEALAIGLRQKYGPEMPGGLQAGSSLWMTWMFDRQGRRVSDSLARCPHLTNASVDAVPRGLVVNPADIQFANVNSTPVGMPGGEACKSLVYLQANLQASTTSSLSLLLYDSGLTIEAGLRTQAVIRGVANADEKQAELQQKKVDKTAVPKF